MRTLIIGGTRFIGPYVVSSLVQSGHDVTVFHRGNTEAELTAGADHIHGDREHLSEFALEFTRLQPDVVIDMYLQKQQDAASLMQTFKGVAGRVVAISSMDAYQADGKLIRMEGGAPDASSLKEDSPLRSQLYPYRPRATGPGDHLYHYDKIPIERNVMSEPDLPGTVLRLPCVYGPLDYQRRLFPYLKRMDDSRPFIPLREGMFNWRWTRGYVENIALAIAVAATDPRSASRIYNVGEAEALSETDWIRAIGRVAGWDGEVVATPPDLLPRSSTADYDWRNQLYADTTRFRRELDYEDKIRFEEGLIRTVAWERENPPAEIDPDQFDYAAEDAALRTLTNRGPNAPTL
jgi:nucleoside-diphosphate-sugar epimerase